LRRGLRCARHCRLDLSNIDTVKQLSSVADLSVHTLHYYDEIGLLAPSTGGSNGYRYSDGRGVVRLQRILFYHELGLSLDEIRAALRRPDFEVPTALEQHKKSRRGRGERLEMLIKTVDNTVLRLKGQPTVPMKQLPPGFHRNLRKHLTWPKRLDLGSRRHARAGEEEISSTPRAARRYLSSHPGAGLAVPVHGA